MAAIAQSAVAPGRKARGRPRGLGFTLMELLIVIAIIALLTSIMLPSLSQSRQAARRAVCAANLHHIARAELMYANDHGDRTPRLRWPEAGGPDVREGNIAWTYDVQYPCDEAGPVGLGLLPSGGYVPEDGHLFYCPSQTAWSCQYDNPNIGWYYYGKAAPDFIPGTYRDDWTGVSLGYFSRRSQDLAGQVRALTGDMWYAGHWETCHNGRGINVAYSDGSVQWLMDDRSGFRGCPEAEGAVEQVWAHLDGER